MALLATLTDTFATISGTKWTTSGTVVVDPALGGMARITVPGTATTTAGLTSASTFDATGSSISAQIGVPYGNGLTNNKILMRVFLDVSNWVEMRMDGTSLVIESGNAGTPSTTTVGNYDPSSHKFWKIAFSAGTATFSTSSDGITYGSVGTKTYSFAITAIRATFLTSFPSGTPGGNAYAYVALVSTSPAGTSILSAYDPATGPVMNPIRWRPFQWGSAPYNPTTRTAQDGANPWIKSTLDSALAANTTSGFISNIQYALTGFTLNARIVPGGGVTGVPYVQTQFQLFLDANNSATIMLQSGTMFANTLNAGVATQTTIGSYSATAHAWWRIGEAGGNILYSVSADGVTWTQVASHAHSFAVTALWASFGQNYPSGTMVGTSSMYVDMIGAPSPAAPTLTVTPSTSTGANTLNVGGMAAYQNLVITRNNYDGSFTTVRGANPFLGTIGTTSQVFTDYEAPIGVANSYTAVASVPAPDGTTMYSASVTSSAATIAVPAGQTVWVKSLSTPSLSGTFRLADMGDITRPARVQTYNVVGRKNVVVVADVQGGRSTTLTFHARTRAERGNLLALMASGSVLFIQADSSKDGFEDMYFEVTGDGTEAYPANFSTAIDRTVVMPVTEVDSPSGATTAIPGNSWLLVTSFGTWSAVSTQRTSWQDCLNRPYGS